MQVLQHEADAVVLGRVLHLQRVGAGVSLACGSCFPFREGLPTPAQAGGILDTALQVLQVWAGGLGGLWGLWVALGFAFVQEDHQRFDARLALLDFGQQ